MKRERASRTLFRLIRLALQVPACIETMVLRINENSPEGEVWDVDASSTLKLDFALLHERTTQWGLPSAGAIYDTSPTLLAIYNKQPAEKRVALDGKEYTRMEFRDLYGLAWYYY